MGHNYTNIQKLSLAGVVIGTLMCVSGALAPYWIISDPQGFGLVGSIVGKVLKGYCGLFMYCAEVLHESQCEVFDFSDRDGAFHMAAACGAGCVLLASISAFVALCLACCTCCRRFVCLGILSFLAAVAGAACAIIFAKNTDVYTTSVGEFKLTSYGWAFYLFCAGVALLGLVSFTSCFAAPDNPLRGVVLGNNNPSVMMGMQQSQPYVHLQEEGGHTASPAPAPAYPAAPVVLQNSQYGY